MKSAMIGNAGIVIVLGYLLSRSYLGSHIHTIAWAATLVTVVIVRLVIFWKPLNHPPMDYEECRRIENRYALISTLGAFGIGFGSFYFSIDAGPVNVAAVIIIGQPLSRVG